MGLRFFDEFGNAIDAHEWQQLKWKPDVWHMADHAADGYVSTVYVGTSLDDPPLIYETMCWGGPLDEQRWLWGSMAQATVGHLQVLKWVEGRDHALDG